MERTRAQFEREQNEFLSALQDANKEVVEAQQAHTDMEVALAAYKAAAADSFADESSVAELKQRYASAQEAYAREAAEAEAAIEKAAREQAEFEMAKCVKEQEERDLADASAALQRELQEASLAASVFEQVLLF